ncbi:MAG: hypothetical protein IT379_03005 [Deltaproteobacteria bacterium]|nr:hypothetical protein [Deltaproteobacteria bacterium]
MRTTVGLVAVLLAGCAAEVAADGEDGIDEVGVVAGKDDGPFSECELREVLGLVNDAQTTLGSLMERGVPSRGARNLVAHRDGIDATPGTDDDDRFDDIDELDGVAYVGPQTFRALVALVADRCTTAPDRDADVRVIFSPEPWETSHLAAIVASIDAATRSIDLAMYSLRDGRVMEALVRAAGRGVSIRVVYEGASADRANPAGTTSQRLEAAGIDVRWINKVMHHKFAIIDGPRDSMDQAATALLVTGSGNWSTSAGTKYDENTVFLRGHAEANLRFQAEFNHMWRSSRDFAGTSAPAFFESMAIDPSAITDDPSFDVVYTSANFEVRDSSNGPTFTVIRGSNAVADRLVALIAGAERSIHIASGHLRSRPVANALLARFRERPDLDVRVYLDGQEYLSQSSHAAQLDELQACLAAAGTSTSRQQDCNDRGFLWSYVVHEAGIPLRYKYYAYRWDTSYAVQMHHKYMVIDGRHLATGSYNLSDNAEHNTLENMLFFDAEAFPALVAAFEERFETMWRTGEAEGRLDSLMQQLASGTGSVPLVFDPIALDWEQVTSLKRALRTACPTADSEAFRTDPAAHRFCDR